MRKVKTTQLPRLEEKILSLTHTWEHTHTQKLCVYGVRVCDVIQKDIAHAKNVDRERKREEVIDIVCVCVCWCVCWCLLMCMCVCCVWGESAEEYVYAHLNV